MTTALVPANDQDVRLFTDIDPRGHASSVIPLRWCVSKQVAEDLQTKDIRDPRLLVVVTNGGQEVARHLFGLFEEMRYIPFLKPGANVVHATVVWSQGGSSIDKLIFDRYDTGTFKCSVISATQVHADELHEQYVHYSGDDKEEQRLLHQAWEQEIKEEQFTATISKFTEVGRVAAEARLEIAVDAEMFASEPNRLWRWFTELYPWGSQPRDQCHRRQRGLLTLLTLPVSAPLVALVRFGCWLFSIAAVLFLLFNGRRGVSIGPVLHPIKMWPSAVWEDLGPSVYFKVADPEGGYQDRDDLLWIVNPTIMGCLAVIGVVAAQFLGGPPWWQWAAVAAAIPVVGVTLVMSCILVAKPFGESRVVEFAAKRISERKAERAVRQQKRYENDRTKFEHELQLVSCEAEPRVASLEAIPRQRRTLVLRFENAKAKRCKPYAQ